MPIHPWRVGRKALKPKTCISSVTYYYYIHITLYYELLPYHLCFQRGKSPILSWQAHHLSGCQAELLELWDLPEVPPESKCELHLSLNMNEPFYCIPMEIFMIGLLPWQPICPKIMPLDIQKSSLSIPHAEAQVIEWPPSLVVRVYTRFTAGLIFNLYTWTNLPFRQDVWALELKKMKKTTAMNPIFKISKHTSSRNCSIHTCDYINLVVYNSPPVVLPVTLGLNSFEAFLLPCQHPLHHTHTHTHTHVCACVHVCVFVCVHACACVHACVWTKHPGERMGQQKQNLIILSQHMALLYIAFICCQ